MSFTIPDFNLLCDVFTGPWLTRSLRLNDVPCNLAAGRRVQQLANDFWGAAVGASVPTLLLPALTDIRDDANAGGADIIECPAGSGRIYQVTLVDDSGKGYPNEYRRVAMAKIWQGLDPVKYAGLFWPTPIP
jgi:hypothetical protein